MTQQTFRKYYFLCFSDFQLTWAQSAQDELLWWPIVRRPSSVHPCVRPFVRPSTISLNNFSSKTTHWILTILHRNDPWVVLYQSCSNRSSWLHKYVTRLQNRFLRLLFSRAGYASWGLSLSSVQNAIFKKLLYKASSRCPLPNLFKLYPWR